MASSVKQGSTVDSTSFVLELFCSESKQLRHETIDFTPEKFLPTTIAGIKDKIEEDFSIPATVQSIKYEGQFLDNETTLEVLKVRSGDTFNVTYSSEGDCKEIMRTVAWFSQLKDALAIESPSTSKPVSSSLEDLIMLGFNERLTNSLAYKYLLPWQDPRKYANRLYIVQCGGLQTMMDVYASILHNTWKSSPLLLKYLETGILSVIWNLAETFMLRRLILSHNGLEMCMKSLLRQTLREGVVIVDETEPRYSVVLADTIKHGLGLLCNLSELPECHLTIATKEGCLQQLTCISLTPSMGIFDLQLVGTIFMRVANTPGTHPYLAKPVLISRLLDACAGGQAQANDPLLLKYFTQVFLAQIVLTSPQHVVILTEDLHQRILQFMESFISTTTYQSVREQEIKYYYVWSCFLPYVKLLYFPEPVQKGSTDTMTRMCKLSQQTALLSLQNMLGRDVHREIVVKESLEDFVTCMPAHLTSGPLRRQAEQLVQVVQGGVLQLKPPKLINLVKAKLAKMHFGLEQVFNMTAGEIVNRFVQ